MFMHGSFAHIFFNMFALWMFGNSIENTWGPKRFLIFYMVCGIGAGLIQELVQYIQLSDIQNYDNVNLGGRIISVDDYLNMLTTVGASGAIYGILLAFGMMWPDSRIYIYFAIPIKAKYFVIFYGLLELFMGFNSVDNVAHFAHVGGMLWGFLLILYWRHKDNGWTPNFKIKWNKNKTYNDRPKSDWDYNRDRADDERRTNQILEKISKGGYSSLTEEEKEFLFRQSKKN